MRRPTLLLAAALVCCATVLAPADDRADAIQEALQAARQANDLRLDVPKPADLPEPTHRVAEHPNVPYLPADKIDDRRKQALDIYQPVGAKDTPVLVFVHGGAWRMGDRGAGIYKQLCRAFAQRGILAVSVGYRLSPKVKHPAHVRDVAAAVAWVHANAKKYGGRSERMFLTGHSAGGHLAALVATDPTHLKPHGLKPTDLAAVIPLAAPFVLHAGNGASTNLRVVSQAFGDDPKALLTASPLTHVRRDLPPFRMIVGENENPLLAMQSGMMCRKLADAGADARWMVAPARTHVSLIVLLGDDQDPATLLMLDYIAKRTAAMDEADRAAATSRPDDAE